ncbi:hypothetical protein AVEN_18329-1 [Araneus ventricosus]|uniref:Uncharacterized protein n=1 Tax=Araneus ventricosus TaxID=182803 RepID=A0A4Y2EMZ7_ARAVE|nr:hypothetical protein AVEN_18329-1 [Araneus ventricosus]
MESVFEPGILRFGGCSGTTGPPPSPLSICSYTSAELKIRVPSFQVQVPSKSELSLRPLWPSSKVPISGPELPGSSPLKIRRVWVLLQFKTHVGAKRPPAGVARKFGEGDVSLGVTLIN